MARKSRKAFIQAALDGQAPLAAEENSPKDVIWNTAGYARLSVMETRDRKDSEALSNQKAILCDYIGQKTDLKLCGLYADNGETGTNFERSDFQRLMADVRAGKINCIVVKDLSRFGRNCVEAGDYLERVFPFLGVRFISIGDSYDSNAANAGDALSVALRNLVNEAYSLDISRKSGTVLREKMQRGEFIGTFAAYGYLRDPADKHHMIVDPETAPIVQEIFCRVAGGEAVRSVLRWLNAEGILSPCCYRYQKGICLDKRFADGAEKPWSQWTLKKLLGNPVYLGHTVQGRQRSELYAGIRERQLPPSEWIVVENTHEPLVTQEIFNQVQAVQDANRERYYANLGKYDHLGGEDNIFRTLVFCSDCGRPMVRYKEVSHGKRVFYRFLCPNYANLLERSGCAYKFLPEQDVKDTLSRLIAQEAALAVDAAALIKKRRNRNSSRIEQELSRALSERENLRRLRERLMRDLLSGVLDKEGHDRMKEKYAREGQELEVLIERLQKEQYREKTLLTARNPWVAAFQKHSRKVELTAGLVKSLVERITVYGENRMEIQLKYRDERAALLAALEQSGEKVSA